MIQRKHVLFFFTFIMLCLSVVGQETVNVQYTNQPPIIDGTIDALWNDIPENTIKQPFREDFTTMESGQYPSWKAVWDDENIYVLVEVPDDDFYPFGEAGLNNWEADNPELYFDVNENVFDGIGPAYGSGHYQITGGIDNDGSVYMYGDGVAAYGYYGLEQANASNYLVEYSVPISSFEDKNGENWTPGLRSVIGFDISVMDLDEPGKSDGGITEEFRNRINWHNDGSEDESWNNMDEAGRMIFISPLRGDPSLYCEINDLDFGDVKQTGTESESFSVKNDGTNILILTDFKFTESAFSILNTDTVKAYPGDSVKIKIEFVPEEKIGYTGILTFKTNDPSSVNHSIQLQGKGIGAPIIDFSIQAITDSIPLGGSDSISITVSNIGENTLEWSTPMLDFEKEAGSDPLLAENQIRLGSEVWLSLNDDGYVLNAFDQTSSTTITGIEISESKTIYSKNYKSTVYGFWNGYTDRTYSIHVLKEDIYYDYLVSSKDNDGFVAETRPAGWMSVEGEVTSLDPGESTELTINYSVEDLGVGNYQRKLFFLSNGATEVEFVSLDLRVTGIPEISLNINELELVDKYIGDEESLGSFPVYNVGNDTLQIQKIVSTNRNLEVLNDSMVQVAPGSYRSVSYSYSPDSIIEESGALVIISNDPENDSLMIPINALIYTVPQVDSVWTIKANAAYNVGDKIDMHVRFCSPVNHKNSVSIKLNTEPVVELGSKSKKDNTYLFEYLIGEDENIELLDYASDSALVGDFYFSSGRVATAKLPAVGTFSSAHKITIDNTPPTLNDFIVNVISSDSSIASGTMNEACKFIYKAIQQGELIPLEDDLKQYDKTKVNYVEIEQDDLGQSNYLEIPKDSLFDIALFDLGSGSSYSLYIICSDTLDNWSRLYQADFTTLATDINESLKVGLSVYPNPNNGSFSIELLDEILIGSWVEVIDINGRVMAKVKLEQQVQVIELNNVESGIYFVKFKSETNLRQLPIIIE